MPDLAFFLRLETAVWEALVQGDAAADHALLTPDFLGVFCTGFAGRDEHSGQLDEGPTVARYALGEARLLPLCEAHALLAYRAEFTRVGRSESEAMYVSSIWEERGDLWLNIFSQDTAENSAAPV